MSIGSDDQYGKEAWEHYKILEKRYNEGDIRQEELLELGFLCEELDHDELKAISIFEEVIKIYPGNIHAKLLLADFSIMHGLTTEHLNRARELADEIITLNCEYSAAGFHFLAWIHDTEIGPVHDPERQLEFYGKAIEISSTWPMLHYCSALNYKELGNYQRALQEATETLDGRIAPDPKWPYYRKYIEDFITGKCPNKMLEASMLKLKLDLENELSKNG